VTNGHRFRRGAAVAAASPRTVPAVRRSIALLAVAVAALAFALSSRSHGSDEAPGATLSGRVVRVVDGDTIQVALAGGLERVRYIGIDTPESVKPGTAVQCYAHRAAAENARLVAGRRVRLVLDVEARDRFGRLLAYVYRSGDGAFVNAELARGGFARTLTIPPNVRFAARFRALAAQARRAHRGLWSACAPA
jgi:micrococcal nuclease